MWRAVIAVWDSVSRDHGSGFQRLDLVQGGEPFESRSSSCFREVRMDAVVDRISRDHESERRHVQAG